ncbi:hypothetical protein E3N88_00268 [Mikania micrantha]|uniref:Uncharacterized protein n=1 Tax=Mikania micrantha TaxID=192012 RepID=A0A5N6PXZ5_9ASTR|nr:hypothetical protein E3N88_00268 [Mikania micrantha]
MSDEAKAKGNATFSVGNYANGIHHFIQQQSEDVVFAYKKGLKVNPNNKLWKVRMILPLCVLLPMCGFENKENPSLENKHMTNMVALKQTRQPLPNNIA